MIHASFTLSPASPKVFSLFKLNQPAEAFKGHGAKCHRNIFATQRTPSSISPRIAPPLLQVRRGKLLHPTSTRYFRMCVRSQSLPRLCTLPLGPCMLQDEPGASRPHRWFRIPFLAASPETSSQAGATNLPAANPALPPLPSSSPSDQDIWRRRCKSNDTPVSRSQAVTSSTSSQVMPQLFALPS